MSIRTERAGSEFEKALAEMIPTLSDPLIRNSITVTKTIVSEDLKEAKVYVSLSGNVDYYNDTIKALNKASSYLRHCLAKRFDHLKTVPRLYFVRDVRQEYADRIEELLRGS